MGSATKLPSVSVVTVTNRPGSIDVTWSALARQTLRDFEWILCDELFAWRRDEVAAFVDDERLRHIPAPQFTDGLWNLNRSYNEALRHCRGELVVSLQDYIWVEEDGLERFWSTHAGNGGNVLVSGVTATYALPAPLHRVDGKVTVFEAPCTEPPTQLLRVDEGRFRFPPGVTPATPISLELNWAAAPLGTFYDIGGFAEDHDRLFYSCDNVTVAVLAERHGYEFAVDRDNVCRALDQAGIFPRPPDWEERHGLVGPWERWYNEWVASGCPRLGYLSRDERGASPAR